jgi:hypothetical protein
VLVLVLALVLVLDGGTVSGTVVPELWRWRRAFYCWLSSPRQFSLCLQQSPLSRQQSSPFLLVLGVIGSSRYSNQ